MAYRLPNSFSSLQQVEALLNDLINLKPTEFDSPHRWSVSLYEFTQTNSLGHFSVSSRAKLVSFLKGIIASGPQFFLVVARMPNSEEIAELTGWFRSRIHPQAILHVSQNSDLIAGLVLRTEKAVYDLSLRNGMYSNLDKLVERIQHA